MREGFSGISSRLPLFASGRAAHIKDTPQTGQIFPFFPKNRKKHRATQPSAAAPRRRPGSGRAGEQGSRALDVAKTEGSGLTGARGVAYTNDNTMALLHSETSSTPAATARGVGGSVNQGIPHTSERRQRVSPSGGAVNTTTADSVKPASGS